MKLLRFGSFRLERPGIELPDGRRKDCSSLFSDWNGEFFASGGLAKLKAVTGDFERLPDVPANIRLGSCERVLKTGPGGVLVCSVG